MATKVINTILKFKRANASEWPSDYILQEAEPGFELDTGKLKIGDGKTVWSQLNYLNGVASINTDGALEYINGTLSFTGLQGADLGQVPSKAQNGAITWITPLTENTITDSSLINSWIENKITSIANRVYKGEAAHELNGTFYNADWEEIQADINDVYSYQDKKYIWTGTEWAELEEAEVYASKYSLDNLTTRVTSLENGAILLASENDAGKVKSSNSINKISVNSDGTMSINSIGIDKLVNNGYTLILDNGQS